MSLRKLFAVIGIAAAVAVQSLPASAMWLAPSKEDGGTVYANLDNGNTLGLFDIVGANAGGSLDLAAVQALQHKGNSIFNIYAGRSEALKDSPEEYTLLNDGFIIEALTGPAGKIEDAVWLEFASSGNGKGAQLTLILERGKAPFVINGKSTQIETPDLAGPGEASAVPVPPAAIPMLSALAGLLFLRSRRQRRQADTAAG